QISSSYHLQRLIGILRTVLDPPEIVNLQHVCKRFLEIGRDNTFWREHCFLESAFLKSLRRRRELLNTESSQEPHFRDLARALADGNGFGDSRLAESRQEARSFKEVSNEKIRILANWDPSYPQERINWYDEWISRHGPIQTSWVQQPRRREGSQREHLEIRGMGLYTEPGDSYSTLVVAPLDDGSVCIWDIGTKGRKGQIISRSKPGILFAEKACLDGAANHPKLISPGVTECVSVDSARKRAYIAVLNDIIEVDLQTLTAVGREILPSTITALSDAKCPCPITVGTNLSLYLYDPRTRTSSNSSGEEVRLDSYAPGFNLLAESGALNLPRIPDPEPSVMYAHLTSGPLSILHLPSSGHDWDVNGEIYVAGRFPSILNYDRRYFPKLRGSIHSGARLCSMTSLPYPFASMDKDLARRGELSLQQVEEAKTRPGKTLIACGEYNSKGSLEMYGLSPNPYLSTSATSSNLAAGRLQDSVMKNRQTSSNSKLLSVSNHGTRIVVSDGGGNLKWLERDGFTEARKWNIADDSVEAPRGIFGSAESDLGDIAIKLANTHNGRTDRGVNEDNLVLWTGEKIGLLRFSSKPGFSADDFEEKGAQTPEEAQKESDELEYSQTMRRALQINADEVRFMRGLGLGLGGSGHP
ncbi:hypothetical protein HYFRA_00012316, partial [Hymenoscyphus fraxineus]